MSEFRKIGKIITKKILKMAKNNNTGVSGGADSIIRNHMIWSMGAGFIPVPIADLFAVSAIQLDMIRQLCKLYEKDFKHSEGKAMITALTSTGLARLGARAVKFIPGVGSVLGGVTLSVLSGASTYALGEVFKKHFETGGTFLDFDPGRLKKYYQEKFEKGKKVAEDLAEKDVDATENAEFEIVQNDPVDGGSIDELAKLKELVQLKEAGAITDAEFKKMKKKIIDS